MAVEYTHIRSLCWILNDPEALEPFLHGNLIVSLFHYVAVCTGVLVRSCTLASTHPSLHKDEKNTTYTLSVIVLAPVDRAVQPAVPEQAEAQERQRDGL